jgi:signal transduction histidine kinase
LRTTGDTIVLRVRDYGKGMPPGTLEKFLRTGADSGVGLAGMRERIREQSGKLEIQSDGNGTLVEVILPISVPPGVPERSVTLSA